MNKPYQMKEADNIENKLIEYIQDLLYTCPLPCTIKKPLTEERLKELTKLEKKYYRHLIKLAYKIVEWRIIA